jgi:hypothetical protein
MQDAVGTPGLAGLSGIVVECGWEASCMAKVIMFYVPEGFRRESVKWIPLDQPGKVIEFRTPEKKSA